MFKRLRERLGALVSRRGREPRVRRVARDVGLTPLVDPEIARKRTLVPFADPDTGTQVDIINNPEPPRNSRG
ncbi:MAG: hypothetical protein ACE147_04365 [Candidatus Methylomirabilales bacterium]